VWVTQGPISDRSTERLGTTDRGIILFRSLLDEQIRRVENGEDPMALVRDPARNTPMIAIHRERSPFTVSGGNRDLFAARRDLSATTP
jgi:5,5'-dehydrodivanillate O-demethylase